MKRLKKKNQSPSNIWLVSRLRSLCLHHQVSHGFSSYLPVFDVFQEPFIISIGASVSLVHLTCLSQQPWPLRLPVPLARLWETLSAHTQGWALHENCPLAESFEENDLKSALSPKLAATLTFQLV